MSSDLKKKKRANAMGHFSQTMKAIGLVVFRSSPSLLTMRRCGQIKPHPRHCGGVIAAIVFVVGLVLLIQWVVSSGVAR